MISQLHQIGVVGLGRWGTALAHHLGERGHDVLGWSREEEVVASINENNENRAYFPGLRLAPEVRAALDIELVASRPIVVLAIPASALAAVADQIQHIASGTVVVSGVKGLVDGSLTPLQFLQDRLGCPERLVVLSGPSFAQDIANGLPAGIVAASTEEQNAWRVANIFSGGGMKVYPSTDALGVELGGICKNVIAIAVGVSDGAGFGDSARAGLITRGLAEMTRLATRLGAKRETLSGLSGLGDLVMTATCNQSRNRSFGLLLGEGKSVEESISLIHSTVEGARTASLVLELGRRCSVELPITEQVVELLNGRTSPQEVASTLLSRPLRTEF